MTEETIVRRSPFFSQLEELGSVTVQTGGWEPTWYYESNRDRIDDFVVPEHVDDTIEVGLEHQAVRNGVGMCDLSSMFPFEVSGSGAPDFVQHLLTNDMEMDRGDARYALLLNEQGGILGDIVVTRLDENRYFCAAPTGFDQLNMITDLAPADVSVRNQEDCLATVCVWGPKARAVVQPLTDEDMSIAAFPYFTSNEFKIAGIPVIAKRLSFAGEPGWEFWTPMPYGSRLWDRLWESGADHGVVPIGYGAVIAMSLEKGYRLMGRDIGPDRHPIESRMTHIVDMNTDFIGKQGLEGKTRDVDEILTCFTMDDRTVHPDIGQPVTYEGEDVGELVRSGYGYTIEQHIAYAYLPIELHEPGTVVDVEIDGTLSSATVQNDPLFDPKDERLRQ